MSTLSRRKDIDVVFGLRTCKADMTSHGGFVWPTEGYVEAPDWKPAAECGNGLHFLLWGEGDGTLLDWSDNAKWLVVGADAAKVVDLGGKVKSPDCVVVYCGGRAGATAYLASQPGAAGKAIVGGTATAGDSGTATAGDSGTATAGVGGTATAGDSGTVTAGVGGTATAGVSGTATAGDSGTIAIRRWDDKAHRHRLIVGYVGESGIRPDVPYRLDQDGNFVEAAK
jgi:hypothetical protein